ncbi:MAG: HK97 gp10 family phage protein [Dialister invisus]|nr:HK97 gp10 family phage protein [Dialister invisus]
MCLQVLMLTWYGKDGICILNLQVYLPSMITIRKSVWNTGRCTMADVTVDFRGFEELQERIAELNSSAMEEAKRQSMKEMAAVYLAEAKRATPTRGVQTVERNGVTITTNSEHMKRSWNAGTIEQNGREYKVKVFNTASYASYVNDGHRQQPGRYVPILGKRLVKNWVDGLNMAEKAEKETERQSKDILRRNINRVLLRYST